MLFDTLVNNGKSYIQAIDMVLEKCDEAFDYYHTIYEMELSRENYMNYLNDYLDSDYAYEGFVLNKHEEEYLFKNTEASPGVVGKLVSIVQEAWQNLIKWIKKMIAKIKSVFAKKQVEKKISLLEKIVAKNPLLKNKKVTIPDPKPNILEKLKFDLDRVMIKIKTGKNKSEIEKELNDIKKREEMISKAKKGAVIVISIAGAILILKQLLDFNKMEKNIATESSVVNISSMQNDPEIITDGLDAEKVKVKIEKHRHWNIFKCIKDTPDILFKTVNGERDINKNGDMARKILGGDTADRKAYNTIMSQHNLNQLGADADDLLKNLNNNTTMGTSNPTEDIPTGDPNVTIDTDYSSDDIDLTEESYMDYWDYNPYRNLY